MPRRPLHTEIYGGRTKTCIRPVVVFLSLLTNTFLLLSLYLRAPSSVTALWMPWKSLELLPTISRSSKTQVRRESRFSRHSVRNTSFPSQPLSLRIAVCLHRIPYDRIGMYYSLCALVAVDARRNSRLNISYPCDLWIDGASSFRLHTQQLANCPM